MLAARSSRVLAAEESTRSPGLDRAADHEVNSNTQNYTAPASPTLASSESVIDGSSFSSAACVAP